MSEKMKKDNKECVVIQPNTGTEADMLGQVLLWVERSNRPPAHKIHSKKPPKGLKGYSFLSRSEVAKMISKRKKNISENYLNELAKSCWRRLKSFMDKKDAEIPKYLKGVRKKKVNGK